MSTWARVISSSRRVATSGIITSTIGGALNDPVKQTRALWPSFRPYVPTEDLLPRIGAVDIGGTWLRFARFTEDWKMVDVQREPYPKTRVERVKWIEAKVRESGVRAVTLLALSDSGVPCHDEHLAEKLRDFGVPRFGCTPTLLPELLSGPIEGVNLAQLAARLVMT